MLRNQKGYLEFLKVHKFLHIPYFKSGTQFPFFEYSELCVSFLTDKVEVMAFNLGDQDTERTVASCMSSWIIYSGEANVGPWRTPHLMTK
jgi:hypothetical protein